MLQRSLESSQAGGEMNRNHEKSRGAGALQFLAGLCFCLLASRAPALYPPTPTPVDGLSLPFVFYDENHRSGIVSFMYAYSAPGTLLTAELSPGNVVSRDYLYMHYDKTGLGAGKKHPLPSHRPAPRTL